MKAKEIRVGMRVYDRWYFWKVGRVVWKGKTRLHVEFPKGRVTYDAAHYQFLEPLRSCG